LKPLFRVRGTMPRLPLLLSAMLLGACASVPSAQKGEANPYDEAETLAAGAIVPSSTVQARPVTRLEGGELVLNGPEADSAAPTLIRGTDQMFRPPPARPPVRLNGQAVSLDFEQAPVTDVAHAILGDILQVPYVINQPVAGSLTIRTALPLEREKVFPVFESLLQANGLAVMKDASGVYHVGRPETLRGVAPSLGSVSSLPSGSSMVIVPLQYIGAVEMADILKPMAPAEAFVRVDAFRNLLMLAGHKGQIEGWMEIVRTFDVDVLKGMSVGLFPLQYASVKEVEAALGALLSGPGVGTVLAAEDTAQRPTGNPLQQAARQPRPAPAQASAGSAPTAGPIGSVVKIIGIERLNALLVITPRAYYIDQAREWIAKFDQPREGGTEPNLYVYPVQNGTASHLSGLLSAIFGATGTTQSPTQRTSGVAPGLTGTSSSTANRLGGTSTSTSSGGLMGASAQQGEVPAPISQVELGPQIRVVADEYNNALLIYAPRSEYRKIESALRQLDKSPTQVLIEASIVEVTLRDELQFGLQWFFEGRIGGGGWNGQGTLGSGGEASFNPYVPRPTGAVGGGFTYSALNPLGQIRAVLNALAEKSLLNVISSPSVMVLDNHTAQIHVGDQQPIRSSVTVTDGGNTTSSIQYKDTGVMLAVTPSVNAGGMVSMTIEQQVTDVGGVDAATNQRSFLQRKISSRVAVRSGESVVLGGLIRDNNTEARAGIPLLHDIPLFGHLFGRTTDSTVRTELLVMLTPRVMQNDAELREVGAEMRNRMQGLKQLDAFRAELLSTGGVLEGR
jgi:general secretion pathway protein D